MNADERQSAGLLRACLAVLLAAALLASACTINPVTGERQLALVTAEIVNVKRAIGLALVVQRALQLDQPLAAGVNGKPAQV